MGGTHEHAPPGFNQAPVHDVVVEPSGTDFGSNATQQGVLASGAPLPPSDGGPPLSPEQQVAKTNLTTAILRRLEESAVDMSVDLRRIVRAEPDSAVRDAVWAEPTFRTSSAWQGHGQTLEGVLRELSPIRRFRSDLRLCEQRAGRSEEGLRVVEEWVGSHASFCDAAVSEGLLDTIESVILDADKEYRAIATLLFKGQLPTGSHANLEQAIAVGDSDRFLAAWIPLLADPTEALGFADNPTWLHRVETKLGSDIYQSVLSDVQRMERTQTAATVLQDLEALVSDCLSGLSELNDWFHVEDAPVLQAFKTYFGKLEGLFTEYNVTDEVTKQTALNTARTRLTDAWKAMHGTELADKLGDGLSKSTIDQISGLLDLNLDVHDQDVQPGVEAPTTDTVLVDLVRAQAATVRVQFDVSVWVSDTGAVDSIRDARVAFREHIHQSAMGVADESTRLAKAMQDLRHTYDQQYASSLVNDIHHGVDDDALAREALQLIGDRLDPNARLMSEAVSQAGAENMEGVSTTVTDLSDAMRDLAERFHDQMVSQAQRKKIESSVRSFGDCMALTLNTLFIVVTDLPRAPRLPQMPWKGAVSTSSLRRFKPILGMATRISSSRV